MAITNHLFCLSGELNTSMAHGIGQDLLLDANNMSIVAQNEYLRRITKRYTRIPFH